MTGCYLAPVRIGVYVDGFNLYYGARGICGRGTPGWRWLDLRALAISLVSQHRNWPDAQVNRVMYCTARIDAASNPSGARDQETYLRALEAADSVDLIEYGTYVSHVRTAPLATRDEQGRPQVVRPEWPVMVQDGHGEPVPGAVFMVSYAHREEKATDVNLATHLLLDVLGHQIDAAMVISNDSDLRLPVREARRHLPVAIVNPSRSYLAGDLHGEPDFGAGRHWWMRLSAADLKQHQLPDEAGAYRKPEGW
jgi:uncharacterized LabA/DUF88 family protein